MIKKYIFKPVMKCTYCCFTVLLYDEIMLIMMFSMTLAISV